MKDWINTIQLGDCYKLIKNIPDKSIDLVYIDIPYLYDESGVGGSDLATRVTKKKMILMGTKEKYAKSIIENNKNRESLKIAKNKAKMDKNIVNIQSGIDWSILDDLCRVMKHIYIYIWCSKK